MFCLVDVCFLHLSSCCRSSLIRALSTQTLVHLYISGLTMEFRLNTPQYKKVAKPKETPPDTSIPECIRRADVQLSGHM